MTFTEIDPGTIRRALLQPRLQRKIQSLTGREESYLVGTHAPVVDTEERGISQVHRSSLGMRGLRPILGPPTLSPDIKKIRPTTWFETNGAYQRILRNYDSALEECMLPVPAHRQQSENLAETWIDCQDHSSMHATCTPGSCSSPSCTSASIL